MSVFQFLLAFFEVGWSMRKCLFTFSFLFLLSGPIWAGTAVSDLCVESMSGRPSQKLRGGLKALPNKAFWVKTMGPLWSNSVAGSVFSQAGYVNHNFSNEMGSSVELEMYFRMDHPKVKKQNTPFLLIHGLGDHSGSLNQMADQLLRAGYPVIRVDLLGFGRSLLKQLEKGQPVLDIYDIRWQALALEAVLKVNFIRDVHIIGHSYGGAVALLLANRLGDNPRGEIKVSTLDLLAFYAEDLREWYVKNTISGSLANDTVKAGAKYLPIGVGASIQNHLSLQDQALISYIKTLGVTLQFAGVNRLTDAMFGPRLNKIMYNNFKPYFESQAELGGANLSDVLVEEMLDQLTRATIGTTNGAKKFNLFHPSERLPRVAVPIRIFAGKRDELVPLLMMKQAEARFIWLGYNTQLITIEDAGHLMSRTHAEQIIDVITSQ